MRLVQLRIAVWLRTLLILPMFENIMDYCFWYVSSALSMSNCDTEHMTVSLVNLKYSGVMP